MLLLNIIVLLLCLEMKNLNIYAPEVTKIYYCDMGKLFYLKVNKNFTTLPEPIFTHYKLHQK